MFSIAPAGRATDRQLACKLDASTRAKELAQLLQQHYPDRVMSQDVFGSDEELKNCLLGQEVLGILEYPQDGFVASHWSEYLESLMVGTSIVMNEVVRSERQ